MVRREEATEETLKTRMPPRGGAIAYIRHKALVSLTFTLEYRRIGNLTMIGSTCIIAVFQPALSRADANRSRLHEQDYRH